jgi:hypothetical protein
MLLPHAASYVRDRSLHWHLALATFLIGKGNRHLLAELIKTLYMAWYLREEGFGETGIEDYLEAERVLAGTARISSRDIWLIEAADSVAIVRILDVHERQLLAAPAWAVMEATMRLANFGMRDKKSPWRTSVDRFGSM